MNLRFLVKCITYPLNWALRWMVHPFCFRYYSRKVQELPAGTRIFFLAREDFGVGLNLTHYAGLWHEMREPVCVVLLSTQPFYFPSFLQTMCPKIEVIFWDHWYVRFVRRWLSSRPLRQLYDAVYCRLRAENLHSVVIHEKQLVGCKRLTSTYIPYQDPHLRVCGDRFVSAYAEPLSDAFIAAYIKARKRMDYRRDFNVDYARLYLQDRVRSDGYQWPKEEKVFEQLKIDNKFVLINISDSKYHLKFGDNYWRNPPHPSVYNSVIDLLIDRGYTVVLQGRPSKRYFAPRKHLIDYSQKPHNTLQTDCALLAHCEFFIANKNGAEQFCSIFDVPTLGFNYTELVAMIADPRVRFYPKHLRSRTTGEYLHWKELLTSPTYFDVGEQGPNKGYEYCNMSEEEMVAAVEEFLPLIGASEERWSARTERQKEFQKLLTPFHLDLYDVTQGAPCDTYLARYSSHGRDEDAASRKFGNALEDRAGVF